MSQQCKALRQSPAGAEVRCTLCERLDQTDNARAYNELINGWTGIESAAATQPPARQEEMFQ
jgi:hypothetical protein